MLVKAKDDEKIWYEILYGSSLLLAISGLIYLINYSINIKAARVGLSFAKRSLPGFDFLYFLYRIFPTKGAAIKL